MDINLENGRTYTVHVKSGIGIDTFEGTVEGNLIAERAVTMDANLSERHTRFVGTNEPLTGKVYIFNTNAGTLYIAESWIETTVAINVNVVTYELVSPPQVVTQTIESILKSYGVSYTVK